MFESLSRSWSFAKMSFGIIWDFKQLMLFPLISTFAAFVVLASFLIPLWGTGTLEAWMEFMDDESAAQSVPISFYIVAFLFYFANYFVIIFFNSALTACAFKVINGEAPSVGYGMSTAGKRLPQILGWALVSAVIGMLLKAVENANEKAGRLVAALLGSAWTAMTYFVVPVIVIEGAGPYAAFTKSMSTLKTTWGTALTGNFSMGFLSFLIMLPIILVAGLLGFMAAQAGNTVMLVLVVVVGVILVLIASAFTSAADVVFKAILYNWATDKAVPSGIDTSEFRAAFAAKE